MQPNGGKWGRIGARHVHFWAFLISGKNVLAFLGDATARGMSLFGHFLFPEKMFWRFWGMQRRVACPKIGVSYFRKKWFGVFETCCKMRHVLFWAFLILKKSRWQFGNVFSIVGVILRDFHRRSNRKFPTNCHTSYRFSSSVFGRSRARLQMQILCKESISLLIFRFVLKMN